MSRTSGAKGAKTCVRLAKGAPRKNRGAAKRSRTPLSKVKSMRKPRSRLDDRVVKVRRKIREGFYNREEVRRAIAEALVFVLAGRRDEP